MRISDWSSDVCSADLVTQPGRYGALRLEEGGSRVLSFREKGPGDEGLINGGFFACEPEILDLIENDQTVLEESPMSSLVAKGKLASHRHHGFWQCMDSLRSEEHTSELQSLLRISNSVSSF